MTIEFGTIDTNEFCFAANGNTAGTAHTCSVDHNCVERNNGGYIILFCEFAHELHHNGGADGNAVVNLFAFDDTFDTFGNKAFIAVRAVVGHNDYLVGHFTYLLFKDDEVL